MAHGETPMPPKGCAQRSPARQGQNLHQVWLELLPRSPPTPWRRGVPLLTAWDGL